MNIFLISFNNFKFLENYHNHLHTKLIIIIINNIIVIQSPKLFKKNGETE